MIVYHPPLPCGRELRNPLPRGNTASAATLLLIVLFLSACGDAAPGGGENLRDRLAAVLGSDSAASEGAPRLSSFAVRERWTAAPAPVDLNSHPRASRFRTALRRGAAEGPNFAGNYTVVSWGCGTMCQEFMVVDARTGRVYDGRVTAVGVEHRIDSRLLTINPPERVAEAGCSPENCPTQHLEWTGERLEPVLSRTDRDAIHSAARGYVRANSVIREFTVQIDAAVDDHVRATVVPAGGATDPAQLYLRRTGARWEGIALGTGFTPEDFDRLRIPWGVRPSL